ncbi:MAG: hypothetical protein Q7U04_10735, partial [Bacteriovorax sp.]|nr:hypothetical protein [Bacteriovorax sp.]
KMKTGLDCSFKIVSDTPDFAESIQTCKMGTMETKTTSKINKISTNVFETKINTIFNGVSRKTSITTTWLGQCSSNEGAANPEVNSPKKCSECIERVNTLKEQCKNQRDTNPQMCAAMTQQMESLCKLGCNSR